MTSSIPEETIVDVHPVLQNANSNQNSEIKLPWYLNILSCLLFFGILYGILKLIYIVILSVIFSVITSDTLPGVNVDDVILTRFMLSPTNNTLYFYAEAKITFRNPYSNVDIQFDKIGGELMYQDQQLGTKEMKDPFLLRAKEKSNVNVVLRGERVLQLIHADEKLVYESESKKGVFKIGVKVRIVIRAKAMSSYTDQYTYKIMRDNLDVPLISSSEGVLSSI